MQMKYQKLNKIKIKKCSHPHITCPSKIKMDFGFVCRYKGKCYAVKN
jgi:hypothetical protein